MAKLGTLTLKGASGESYEFEVYPADANWRDDVACVYYISKRTPKSDGSGTHTPIYLGETDDLKERLSNHHKQACFDRHSYNVVSVHQDGSARSRLEKEADLIDAIKPPCNG